MQEAAVGVAEIGDRIERDVRHGLAEHDVEDQQVVDRRARIADRIGERVGGLQREARAVERVVERDVAGRDGARGRVADGLAEAEILEEIAGLVLVIELSFTIGSPGGLLILPFAVVTKA